MGALIHDLRYAIRMLKSKPGFTVLAVLTLAFGIAANMTIFSFVDALFYRPWPVQKPDQLLKVFGTDKGRSYGTIAYPEYVYVRDHSTSFETLAAEYPTAPLNVVADGISKEESGSVVSASYFPMLGIRPLLGRFFLPEEDAEPDRNPVAVISFDLWQRRFAGDSAILGKRIRINGAEFQIVGVMSKNFSGLTAGIPHDVWIPTMMLRVGYRWCDSFTIDCRPLQLIGRVAPGRNLDQVRAELTTLAGQLIAAYPTLGPNRGMKVEPARGVDPGPNRVEFTGQMQLLMAVAGLLLLIACTNVAGLLVARGAARRKEIAVRLSLGAGRVRVIRQLLTESLLLSLVGGGLGLILSLWAKDVLAAKFYSADASSYRPMYDLSLDPLALAYCLALSILTGVLFGLAPAVQVSRQDLVTALKDEGRGQSSGQSRLRFVLVAAQVAVSLAMLIGAGLLVRSAANIQKGANFDPTHVALLRLRPRLLNYTPEKAQAFTREVVRRFEALPGVQSVSMGTTAGLAWRGNQELRTWLPGQALVRPEDGRLVKSQEVAPRFLETLKIPLVQGREFNEGDRPGAPRVVIVNETMSRQMWPGESPLGRILIVESQPYQVVGVFKDSRFHNVLEGPAPFLYVAYWQNDFGPQTDARMVVRVAGDPQNMLPLLRRQVAAVDPDVPIEEDVPMTVQVADEYKPVMFASSVLVCAGILALFLSSIGLYGVLAFMVSQRTREIGIRMALGAQQVDVLKLVVRQGMALTGVGIAVGLFVAFGLTHLMSSFLYGVSATDAPTISITIALLAAVALLACYVPARRATKVDPMEALRYE